jgi:hypothetical protein
MSVRVNIDSTSDRYGETEIIEGKDPNVRFAIESDCNIFWNRLA